MPPTSSTQNSDAHPQYLRRLTLTHPCDRMAQFSDDWRGEFRAMNALVQTLVWTTIAGFLYILWLNKQTTSPIHAFERARHLRRVLSSLQTLWIVVGLSSMASLLLVSLPTLDQAAGAVTLQCPPTTSPEAVPLPYAYNSAAALCKRTGTIPSSGYPESQNSKAALAPQVSQLDSTARLRSTGQRIQADSVHSGQMKL